MRAGLAVLLGVALSRLGSAALLGGAPGPIEERTIRQPLDHFARSSSSSTFEQRYFVAPHSRPAVIFFYAGNEAPVEHYIKSCGLMWENRASHRATLVFAEHRFWGESIPEELDYRYMGPEQALEDYYALILALKANATLPVVMFGGSYGGMLAAWARLMRPDLIDAAVASSAPVLAFFDPRVGPSQRSGFYQDGGNAYWRVVTRGNWAPCAEAISAALNVDIDRPGAYFELGACDATRSPDEMAALVAYVLETMTMGDYPFPTDYISDGGLPSWPVTKACRAFRRAGGGLRGLRAALGLFLNSSGTTPCYQVPPKMDAYYDGLWDRMWCGNLMPQETYFSTLGWPSDMFRPSALDWSAVESHCRATWGVFGRRDAIFQLFGAVTPQDWAKQASHIVFSNGLLDPWSAGGFLVSPSASLPVVLLEKGAHHADLFFSQANDPKEFAIARRTIMQLVRRFAGLVLEMQVTPAEQIM